MHVRQVYSALILVLSLLTSASGQNYVFQKYIGPFSDIVTPFQFAPDGAIYIGSGSSGIFRTSDKGRSWITANDGLANPQIVSLVSVSASQTVLASLRNGGIYRFDDDTRRWSQIGTARFLNPNIMVSRNGVIYAYDTTYGVDRSLDSARTWSRVFVPGEYGLPEIFDGAVYEDHLLIGTKFKGVFYSSDRGEHWTNSYTKGLEIASVFYSSTGIALAANGSEGLRSSDNGSTWTKLQTGMGGLTTISEESNGTLWAGNGAGHYSIDSGKSWQTFGSGFGVYRFVYADSGVVLSAHRMRGLARNLDTARSGDIVSEDFANLSILCGCATNKGTVLIGIPTKTLRSTDNGASWSRTQVGGIENESEWLASDARGNVYSKLKNGSICTSQDDGLSWRNVLPDSIVGKTVRIVSVRPNGALSFSTSDTSLHWTLDGGEGWLSHKFPFAINAIFALGQGKHIVGTAGGTFISVDSGTTWTRSSLNLLYSFYSRGEGEPIYAGGYGAIFKSTDEGISWVKTVLSGDREIMTFLQTQDGHFFAGGASIHQSDDDGTSWKKAGFSAPVTLRQFIPLRTGDIFAATHQFGLMTGSRDGQTNFIDAPRSLPSSLSLSSPWPNPASSSATVAVTMQHSGMLRCTVTSMLGARIATLSNAARNAGTHVLSWDGRSEAGLRVPPGLYFINAEMDGAVVSRAMIRLNR